MLPLLAKMEGIMTGDALIKPSAQPSQKIVAIRTLRGGHGCVGKHATNR